MCCLKGWMNLKLNGKVAIVTGGGRGIGRAIALALTKEGADVAIVDLRLAKNVVNAITKTGRRALAIEGDVTNSNDVDHAVEEALKYFGRIDILVNNAGIIKIGCHKEVERSSTSPQMLGRLENRSWPFIALQNSQL